MANWVTISSLATAGGTLVLAVATFGSTRSANRAARVAERSLMVGLRPVLIPSREADPVEQIRFGDGVILIVAGHGAAVELENGNIYLAIGLRNGGSGLAVLHGWRAEAREHAGTDQPDLESFHRQMRDLYIPAGDVGYWQGPIRDRDDPAYEQLRRAAATRGRVLVDLRGSRGRAAHDRAIRRHGLLGGGRPPRRGAALLERRRREPALGSGVGNPSALGLAPRRVAAPSVCTGLRDSRAGETIGEGVPRGAYTS